MANKPQAAWEIYKEQMSFLRHGNALWEPAPTEHYERINFGDVGFIRRGQFYLLFSAGCPLGERRLGIDVPLTFEELDIGTPVFRQPRQPGCLSTNTVREIGAGLGASVVTAPLLEPGAHLSYELTGNRGAALVTRYETYVGDIKVQDAFEQYTKEHYDSWVTFARNKRYGDDVEPVLVCGFDLTKDFAMAAYSRDGASLESDLTISVPMVGSASASLRGTWRTRGSTHTNHGPQQCIPPAFLRFARTSLEPMSAGIASDDYKQCVFVRYYTVRKRMGFYPKVMQASAGPHDLGSGHNHDDTFPELTARQDSVLDDEDDPMGGGEEQDLIAGETCSDQDIVVCNAPDGEEDDEFDAIAEYVFQNSNATSVLMQHGDLAGIHAVEGVRNVSSILAKSRPRIMVDESGVGQIVCGEDPSQRLIDPVGEPPQDVGPRVDLSPVTSSSQGTARSRSVSERLQTTSLGVPEHFNLGGRRRSVPSNPYAFQNTSQSQPTPGFHTESQVLQPLTMVNGPRSGSPPHAPWYTPQPPPYPHPQLGPDFPSDAPSPLYFNQGSLPVPGTGHGGSGRGFVDRTLRSSLRGNHPYQHRGVGQVQRAGSPVDLLPVASSSRFTPEGSDRATSPGADSDPYCSRSNTPAYTSGAMSEELDDAAWGSTHRRQQVRKRQREKKEEDRKSESIQLQRVKELLGMEKKATRADTLEKVITFLGGDVPAQMNEPTEALQGRRRTEHAEQVSGSQRDISRMFDVIGKCMNHTEHTPPKRKLLLAEVANEIEQRTRGTHPPGPQGGGGSGGNHWMA